MKYYFIASYRGVPPIQYGPFLSEEEAQRYTQWLDEEWQRNDCGEPLLFTYLVCLRELNNG